MTIIRLHLGRCIAMILMPTVLVVPRGKSLQLLHGPWGGFSPKVHAGGPS
jgi:hypothetical protein